MRPLVQTPHPAGCLHPRRDNNCRGVRRNHSIFSDLKSSSQVHVFWTNRGTCGGIETADWAHEASYARTSDDRKKGEQFKLVSQHLFAVSPALAAAIRAEVGRDKRMPIVSPAAQLQDQGCWVWRRRRTAGPRFGCWPARPDLDERWPSRLAAQEPEH